MSNQNSTAFPIGEDITQGQFAPEPGMSLREYAAIKLRVPDSGTDWLDAMIERSLLIEFTAKSLSVVAPGFQQMGKEFILTADYPDAAIAAHEMAHEILKASKWGMI